MTRLSQMRNTLPVALVVAIIIPWALFLRLLLARRSQNPYLTSDIRETSGSYLITMTTDSRRFGHKLFMYASLLGIAARTGREVILHEEFDVFHYFDTHVAHKVNNTYTYLGRFVEIKEAQPYAYDNAMEHLNRVHLNIKLNGHFLSWRYFENIFDVVRKEFTFKRWKSHMAEFITEPIVSKNNNSQSLRLVGIHVCRAEVNATRGQFSGFQMATPEYFYNAMKYFKMKYRYSHVEFIVSSDDLDWSKQYIQGSDVTFLEGHPAPLDLAVLTRCDDVIMSVGTFGWWAGWLAGGNVIYYKHWYKQGSPIDSELDRDDHFPPAWIAMD